MNAFFAPHRNGREMHNSVRGNLIPVGTHAGQQLCPPGVTPWSGATLDAIRAAQSITWIAAPPRPVPPSVTPAQLRLQLLADGKITDADDDAVEVAIAAAIPAQAVRDGANLRQSTIIRYRESTEFRRSHPDLISLAGVLGYDDSGLDAFFIAAAKR